MNEFSRREFLKRSTLGLAALSVGPVRPVAQAQKPLERGVPRKRVLIAGAGLAGLVAAYELTQAGHDVTVLEASTRPGGRVWTLREPFSDGLYAEAGAGRIPDWHQLALDYAKQFGLTLAPFYPSQAASVYLLRGKRYKVAAGGTLDISDLPFELTAEERKLGLDGLQHKYVDPILSELGDFTAPGWPPEKLKEFDRMAWPELLQKRGASAGAAALLVALTGWKWDSALDFFRDDLGHRGAKSLWKIRGGNDLLPRAFAERVKENIRYGAPIRRIEQDARGVRVARSQTHGPEMFSADYLICTIPFSVLRRLEITPPFPPDKREVIEKIYYDPVVRTYVQTRRRYWEAEGLNGFAETDEPAEIWQPTFDQAGPRGILHTYLEDDLAERISPLADGERTARGVEMLEKAFPGVQGHAETAFSFCWIDQPWARGAYAAFHPGEITRWSDVIGRPEGRIHFAGEHTSPWPGWMQGALHSGLRAAREIHEAPA